MAHPARSAVLALSLLVAPAARAGEQAPAVAPAPAPPAAAAPGAPPAPATPVAPDPAAQERIAREWREALAREADPLPPVAFETPGGFRGEVEAKGAPEVKGGEKSDELVVPLGLDQPVTCTIVPGRLDAGTATSMVLDTIRAQLTVLGAMPVEIVAVAGSPLVFSEILYAAPTEQGRVLGLFKSAVYAHETRSFICQHDQPGYSKTFQRAVAALAASLQGGAEDEREGARFREISIMRVQGVPVGFAEQAIWDRKGGGRVVAVHEAMVMPRSQTELAATDVFREESSDPEGLLVSGTYAHVTGGTIDGRMRLEREKDARSFRYDGERHGKKLAGSFKTKAGLATDLWFARRFAAKAAPAARPVRHEGFAFTANPTGAVVVAYERDPAKAGRTAVSVGAMRIAGELDEHGFLRSGEIPLGAATLVLQRAWSTGTP